MLALTHKSFNIVLMLLNYGADVGILYKKEYNSALVEHYKSIEGTADMALLKVDKFGFFLGQER